MEIGRASCAQRRAAFDNAGLPETLMTLIDKVVKHAYKVTDRRSPRRDHRVSARTRSSSWWCARRSVKRHGSTIWPARP